MPAWLEILLLAIVAIVILLFLAGAIVNARRRRTQEADFTRRVEAANARLAAAAAEDRGWERAGLERAAREVWEADHPGEEVLDIALVEVTDLPGTDADAAVFQVTGRRRSARVALARRPEGWARAERG